MQMMKISEEELKEFSNQRLMRENRGEEDDNKEQHMLEELFVEEEILQQAKERLGKDQ